MKSSNNLWQGDREIMAGFFKISPFISRPVWCHDRNQGQHPNPDSREVSIKFEKRED